MHITLVEPNLSGHHKIYLISFVSALKSLGHSVTILSDLFDCDFEQERLCYIANKRIPSNKFLKKIIVAVNFFISVSNLWKVRRLTLGKTDLVFFCCIDDYMNELMPLCLFDMIFPINYSGLLLTPRDRKMYLSFDRRKIFLSKHCSSIGVLDEFCRKDLSKFCSNIIQFPDFSDASIPNLNYSLAIEIKNKANGRKIISLLGGISARKGIYTFVRASLDLSSEQYFFVIAGKSHLDESEEKFIVDNFALRSNCCYYNSSIPTESDFNMLISISYIIYAAYVNFSQSSNMLAKSSLFKKPLIVSKGGYMEEIVNKYSLGLTINSNSVKECVDTIHYYSKITFESEGCSFYLKNNSIGNLNLSFENVIERYKQQNENVK